MARTPSLTRSELFGITLVNYCASTLLIFRGVRTGSGTTDGPPGRFRDAAAEAAYRRFVQIIRRSGYQENANQIGREWERRLADARRCYQEHLLPEI